MSDVNALRERFIDTLAVAMAEGLVHLGYGGEITEAIRDLVVAADNLADEVRPRDIDE